MDPPRQYQDNAGNEDTLSFVVSSDIHEIEGSMHQISGDGLTSSQYAGFGKSQNYSASHFFQSKGFGWLLEVEDGDADIYDKPLLEELDIDLKDIYYKVRCVLLPLPQLGFQRKILKDSPDFWGPLLIVLLYSLVSLYGQFKVVSWIITIWFCGSFVVFFLSRALGGEVSYAQSLGVIGYSLLPLTVIALALPFLQQFPYLQAVCKIAGVLWASYSAGSLLVPAELTNKRLLLFYPVFLLIVLFMRRRQYVMAGAFSVLAGVLTGL